MQDLFVSIAWAAIFTFVGGTVGGLLVLLAAMFIPRIISRTSPDRDEEKEIYSGNQAVAEYFGRTVSAAIIGVSIVIAAAVIAGVVVALF
ncbi:MAG: hypothetical protein OEW15_15600 [Nitrospirota bacterium]|nr:hypothetical protein [Nitrospirota bacterium]